MTNPPSIRVTDHAVLRYIERRHGIDVDALRSHIATLAVTGVAHGASAVLTEGVRIVLRGQTVVTVLDKRMVAFPRKVSHGNGTSGDAS